MRISATELSEILRNRERARSRHAVSVRVQSRKQKLLWPERLKTGNYVLTKASGLEELLPEHTEVGPQ